MGIQGNKIRNMSISFHRGTGIVSGAFLMVIAFLICSDIVASWVFGSPIRGVIEISMLIIGWVIAFSFTWGLIQGAQVRVTLFTGNLSEGKRRWFDCAAHLLGFVFLCLMSYGAWLFFWSSWQVKEAMPSAFLYLPWWPGKLALPVGLSLMALQFLLQFTLTVIKKD
ncbi:MAG: TRAP transporter small permease [Deltaproteobacteria bacterium]|nr:TRAP transporter small permease [Deltaproteobacteria bacterium]